MPMATAKFQVGQCCATHGALGALEDNNQHAIVFISRHQSGDWGDLDADDKARNEAALIPNADGECDRIFSAYHLKDGQKIYVITEWDRSRTTIMRWDEYLGETMKTTEWKGYEDAGGFFRLRKGELEVIPMLESGHMDASDPILVDFDGIDPEDAERCRGIKAELEAK
jgi:hypothetical protein